MKWYNKKPLGILAALFWIVLAVWLVRLGGLYGFLTWLAVSIIFLLVVKVVQRVRKKGQLK